MRDPITQRGSMAQLLIGLASEGSWALQAGGE